MRAKGFTMKTSLAAAPAVRYLDCPNDTMVATIGGLEGAIMIAMEGGSGRGRRTPATVLRPHKGGACESMSPTLRRHQVQTKRYRKPREVETHELAPMA